MEVKRFLERQLCVWPDAAARYVALKDVQHKQLYIDGCDITVQFNPARIVSTAANIKADALRQRPCFLCVENRPAQQEAIKFSKQEDAALSQQEGCSLSDDYTLLVNPFPILPQHFTIPLNAHRPQTILGRFADMMRLTRLLSPYIVFYNGPRCGASAPDHQHFQAGSRDVVPLQRDFDQRYRPQLQPSAIEGVHLLSNYLVPTYVILSDSPEEAEQRFLRLVQTLPVDKGDIEPMMNILSWTASPSKGEEGLESAQQCASDELVCVVLPRRLHRPACYTADGAKQLLISPGALDMAGLIITPRTEDFQRITAADVQHILSEVAAPRPESSAASAAPQPRMIRVGLLKTHRLRFRFNAIFFANDGEQLEGAQEATYSGGAICWKGKCYSQLLFTSQQPDASFTIEDVIIGIDFHWEQREIQTFTGQLLLSPTEEADSLYAVNILPLETYLTSVVSSEMSAEAPLEFLKAHAVIARSWVLAAPKGHRLFDVCADDHCQRYQGIRRINNPNAERAVRETSGQVLTYQGNICDTRYSKCCGGQTEVFETCWEDVHHPYLVSVPCPYCGQAHDDILTKILNHYDLPTTDFYRWEVSYTGAELSALLAETLHTDFGRIFNLVPLKHGPSGRICLLRIVGEKQSMDIGKELAIRRALSDSHLYSSSFDVEHTADDRFILRGRGWGHGVGLCQIGAAVMGEQGYDYKAILQHYYPHTDITTL